MGPRGGGRGAGHFVIRPCRTRPLCQFPILVVGIHGQGRYLGEGLCAHCLHDLVGNQFRVKVRSAAPAEVKGNRQQVRLSPGLRCESREPEFHGMHVIPRRDVGVQTFQISGQLVSRRITQQLELLLGEATKADDPRLPVQIEDDIVGAGTKNLGEPARGRPFGRLHLKQAILPDHEALGPQGIIEGRPVNVRNPRAIPQHPHRRIEDAQLQLSRRPAIRELRQGHPGQARQYGEDYQKNQCVADSSLHRWDPVKFWRCDRPGLGEALALPPPPRRGFVRSAIVQGRPALPGIPRRG